MTRLWTALAALLLSTGSASAQVARSPVGVEVDVPAGYRWRPDHRPKATNVIYLESTEAGPNAGVILVNHGLATAGTKEALVFAEARAIADKAEDAAEVTLRSGKFLRVDFDVPMKDPPRTVRQRLYVTLRGNRIYSFFLANLEAERRGPHLPLFDALVDGARFFEPAKPEPAKPEPAKPEPAKPEPAKPEPAKPEPARPDATEPEPARPDATEPEPARPDAEKPGPARPAGPPRPPVPPRNLLAGAKLVRFDSEYDPDVWGASHLIDGRSDRGWCSAPGAKGPFRFVLALPAAGRVDRLAFDAACPEEAGFEGVGAKDVLVEASAEGPDGPWTRLAAAALDAKKNDQVVPVQLAADARWLRVTVSSNHGHATLTELMEVRAWGAPTSGSPAPAGLRLEKARASREKNGPALDGPVAAGARVWINVKPRGLAAGADGKTVLVVDLVLEDPQGHELLRRDRVVEHVAPPPQQGLSAFVAVHLDLPAGFPAGKYLARLVARDEVARTSAAAACEFEVR